MAQEQDNLVKNHSFESNNWQTIEGTSQQPEFWKIHTYRNGEVLRFPLKLQNGALVPARSSGNAGEYVHKGIVPKDGAVVQNLPDNEMSGQERALVTHGVRCFKVFSGGVPDWFAADLYQDLDLEPGRRIAAIVPICAETFDTPTSEKLEKDHFVARVSFEHLNGVDTNMRGHWEDSRMYSDMIHIFDLVLPDGRLCQRPWNFFRVDTVVPPSGQIRLNLYFQQNWPRHQHGCDFFIDDVRAFYIDESPSDDCQKEKEELLRQQAVWNEKVDTTKIAIDSMILQLQNLRRSL